ncbi:MAG: hypothetical protein IT350_01330 [Deltaproteobacteria bacterium]|nr:hypothetical protein [Deltaproteobacteria bacterium]
MTDRARFVNTIYEKDPLGHVANQAGLEIEGDAFVPLVNVFRQEKPVIAGGDALNAGAHRSRTALQIRHRLDSRDERHHPTAIDAPGIVFFVLLLFAGILERGFDQHDIAGLDVERGTETTGIALREFKRRDIHLVGLDFLQVPGSDHPCGAHRCSPDFDESLRSISSTPATAPKHRKARASEVRGDGEIYGRG